MIYAIIIVGLALDQLTKYITVANLKGADSVVLIKNWLEFTYVENTGVAFGSFRGYKYFFILFLWLHFLEFYFIYIKIRIKCLKLNKYYLP